VIINYHRIKADDNTAPSPFDDGVFGPTQLEFETQIRWLRANFDILSESHLLEVVRKRGFKGRFAAITFDDGYSDNYRLAYPVLRSQNTPAIYFICPEIIDKRNVGWWDMIAYMVKMTTKRAICVGGNSLDIEADRDGVIRHLIGLMKLRKAAETDGLLEEISKACGVPPPTHELQSDQFMTWAEVQEVGDHEIAIGSHTHTHRVLATLDVATQRWELQTSKQHLEARLNRPVRTLAYPVGGYDHFTPDTMRLASECGYEAAFSFHTGGVYAGRINPFNLGRIAATDSLDAKFACAAYLPQVFSWYHPMPAEYAV
jgi:peptidoglycan/xylan/chitin deacetylase (PgdA/CDA1 family)